MEKYICFLRGINVGGKNKVSMLELKRLFEENGFFDVLTYINSGNFSRSRLSKVVGSTMYVYITIRNANTVKKVLKLANRDNIEENR